MTDPPPAPDPRPVPQRVESPPTRSRIRLHWPLLVVVGLVAALLWWFVRDIDFAEVWAHIRSADATLLLASVVVALAGFAARAVRWRYFLSPVQPASPFSSRFAAVAVGFMANNLLPSGRAGEPGRAYAYSRMEPVSFTTALATLVVERLLDGAVILGLIVVAIVSPGFPAEVLPDELAVGMRVGSALLAIVLAATVLVVAFPAHGLRTCARLIARLPPGRLATGLMGVTEGVVAGLASMRGWRLMIPALLWTVGVWILQSLSLWVGFLAFDIRLPFAAALLTNGAVAFAASLPVTVGYVGTLQAAVLLSLVEVYGVAPETALAMAVAWHAVNLPPITILGLWYTRRLGISLKDFRRRGPEPVHAVPETANTIQDTSP